MGCALGRGDAQEREGVVRVRERGNGARGEGGKEGGGGLFWVAPDCDGFLRLLWFPFSCFFCFSLLTAILRFWFGHFCAPVRIQPVLGPSPLFLSNFHTFPSPPLVAPSAPTFLLFLPPFRVMTTHNNKGMTPFLDMFSSFSSYILSVLSFCFLLFSKFLSTNQILLSWCNTILHRKQACPQ